MTVISQLSTTKPKKTKNELSRQLEQEPQKWRSHGGLSIGEWEGERGGKGTENK